MPNRYIRESAIESEPVNSLPWDTEVFYRRLLNRVDDFGRFTANLSLLRASIFPLQLERVTIPNIQRMLLECEMAGLLFAYNVDSKDFLVINKWEKGRAKDSRYPAPPEVVSEYMKTYVYRNKHMFADAPDSDSDSDSDSDNDTDSDTDIAGKPAESVKSHQTKSDLQLKAEALVARRVSTPMTRSELRAWSTAKAVVADTDEQSWELLTWWFSLPDIQAPYRRTDFAALLNNWSAEIAKAKKAKAAMPEFSW